MHRGNLTLDAVLFSLASTILSIALNTAAAFGAPPAPGGRLQFTSSTFQTNEGATAAITLTRAGGKQGIVSVDVVVVGGTATPDVDYSFTTATVSWADNEHGTKTVPLPTIDDFEVEPTKTVELALTNIVGGVEFGSPTNATLNIISTDTPTKKTATDVDGDIITLQLKGPGTMEPSLSNNMVLVSLTGSVAGSNSLVITVTKSAQGDGFADIGTITGVGNAGLTGILASHANLVGDIVLPGGLRSLTAHDICANITAGGAPPKSTIFTAHEICDGVTLDFGTSIRRFTAAEVGQIDLLAPRLKRALVKGDATASLLGDFGANLMLSGVGVLPGATTLGRLVVSNAIANSSIVVSGSVGRVAAKQMTDSEVFAGFTPTDANDPLTGGSFVAGKRIGRVKITNTIGGFSNSVLAADNVGTVTLASVTTNNGGVAFGVLAKDSISAVRVTFPPFTWDKAGTNDQVFGDFHVKH